MVLRSTSPLKNVVRVELNDRSFFKSHIFVEFIHVYLSVTGTQWLVAFIDVSLNVTGLPGAIPEFLETGFGCVKEDVRFADFISFFSYKSHKNKIIWYQWEQIISFSQDI